MQEIDDSALAIHPRIIFTIHLGVWRHQQAKKNSPRNPSTASGRVLKELEDWLHNLPGTSVDILRLAGLVGPARHPGFFAGKTAPDGQQGVNLVHLEDVISAITLLLQAPKGGHIYNLCGTPGASAVLPATRKPCLSHNSSTLRPAKKESG
jgi:nucleoside-diphosphate-sugar epimerase